MSLQLIMGIVMLISFAIFAYYVAKGGSYLMAAFVMAMFWSVLAIIGGKLTFSGLLSDVMQTPPTAMGSAIVVILFGSWFGRILLDTGIAASLIRKAVELGGDHATLTAALLCVVTTAIFTGAQGTGLYIAMAVIVLPILFSLGIPHVLAHASYMMAIAAGMFINRVQYASTLGSVNASLGNNNQVVIDSTMTKFFTVCLVVLLLAVITMVVITMKKNSNLRKIKNWAMPAAEEIPKVPGIALLVPLLPVVVIIVLNWPVIPTLVFTSLLALLLCGKIKTFNGTAQIISQTFADGIVDVQNVIGFLFFSVMFNKASGVCAPYLSALLGGIIPTSAIGLMIMFAVCAPLGLFRGPFTVFGSGVLMLNILLALGVPLQLSFPMIYVPTLIMNQGMCPSQSNVIWGLSYSKVGIKEHLRQTFPFAWAACIVCAAIGYFMVLRPVLG